MREVSVLFLILLLYSSCSNETQEKQKSIVHYFDLNGFIKNETKRLQALTPSVNKSVQVNNKAENRNFDNIDWEKELSVFSDADINKAAWENQFIVSKTEGAEIYKTDKVKIPVKYLEVRYKDAKIHQIQIVMQTSNLLYVSRDTLSYFPDSLYEIKKTQHIKFLQPKSYKIRGTFK